MVLTHERTDYFWQAAPRGLVCAFLALLPSKWCSLLADISDLEAVRTVCAGSYRIITILVAFYDTYSVYTCTGILFEQVSPPIAFPVRCIGIT